MGTKISGPYKGFKFNLEAKNALPAPITSLSATAIDFANVQLVFANVLNAVSYQYSVNGGEWTALGGTKIVSGLTGETAYAFRVRGVGVKGNGPESPVANATTLSQLPAQITDLTVTAPTSTTIILTYTDAARATSHEYSLNNVDWFAVPGNKTVTGLSPATTYGVRVRGVNPAGNGASSAPFSITTPATLTYAGFSSASSDKAGAVTITNPYAPATTTTGSWQTARSLVGKTTAQPGYFEVTRGGGGSADMVIGLGGISAGIAGNYVGGLANSVGLYSNGLVHINGGNQGNSTVGLSYGAGDRVMVAYNGTKVWFGKNGVWQAGTDPATNTGGFTLPAGVTAFFPMISMYLGNGAPQQSGSFNFGQNAFAYTPPAGFPAWTTSAYPTSFSPELKSTSTTLSNHNLTAATTGNWHTALARNGRSTGRFYFETTMNGSSAVGFGPMSMNTSEAMYQQAQGIGWYMGNGILYKGGATLATIGTASAGDKIGVAWDGQKVYFRVNGTWIGGADPVAGTGGYDYNPGVPVAPAFSGTNANLTFNFGQTAYAHPAPTGFSNWTVASAPDQVSNLSATGYTATTALISFTDQPNSSSYQYSTNNGTNWQTLAPGKVITGLTPSTTYSQIVVRGMNEFTGLTTGPVSATTPAVSNTTLSTTDKASTAVMTQGDLKMQSNTINVWSSVRSVLPRTIGKWYMEIAVSGDTNTRYGFGLANASAALNVTPGSAGSIQYYSNGPIIRNGTTVASLANYSGGQRVMIATDGIKVWFGVNGTWVLSSNPATNVGGFAHPDNPNDPLYVFLSLHNLTSGAVTTGFFTANFGATAFTYTIPTGFTAWRG